MRGRTVRGSAPVAAALGVVALLAVPDRASAHGVGGDPNGNDFAWLGFLHMISGWDHLLFLAGVVLIAGQLRRALLLITVFALGHSATLIVATLAAWRINAVLVDIVIALSLAFVGVVGWAGRPNRWRWFGATVAAFGLVHGLGLATRLQEIWWHHDTGILPVISFNLGVEIGQLVAVLVMFMVGDVIWSHLGRYVTGARALRVGYATLMLVGLVAGAVLAVGAGHDGATEALGVAEVVPLSGSAVRFPQ